MTTNFTLTACSLVIAACTASTGDPDAGSPPASDASGGDTATPLDRDTGISTDASPARDSAIPSTDAHVPRDTYVHDPGLDVCPLHPITAFEGPFCTSDARACITMCEPGCDLMSVGMTCLAGEPVADACYYCMFWNSLLCAADRGCQRAWDLYNCCGERECATARDGEACIAEHCSAELDAFTACTTSRIAEGTCALSATPCFM